MLSSCHWGRPEVLASPFPLRMFTARAPGELGGEGPGRRGPALSQHPPPPAAASARRGLSRAAPLFSLLQLRLRKCCLRPARRGCRLQPPQRPIKMTTDTEAEGREGGREAAAGEPGWEQRHPHLPARGAAPLRPAPLRPPPPTAGVRAGEELPAPRACRPRRGS